MVSPYKSSDSLGQVMFVGQFETIGNMIDDDPCTLFIGQASMRVGITLVLGEENRTHHGLSKAKYFYISYKNEHPDEEVDESLFTYPGPEPYSMETAILMMADAVEAASRSLAEYTEENISNLVDRIVDGQVAEGHFNNCSITFKDITDIKAVFKEKLRTIHHTRISYPKLKG